MLRTSLALSLLMPALVGGCGLFFGDQQGTGGGGGDDPSTSSGTTTSSAGGGGEGGGSLELAGTYRRIEIADLSDMPIEVPLDDPLEGVPVLVPLAPGIVPGGAVVDPDVDLAFTDETGTMVLPHEVERWDPDGNSVVWVRLPEIAGPSVPSFRMYYGDFDRPIVQDPGGVWADHYDVVYHFGQTATVADTPDAALADGANDGMPGGGGSFTEGPIGEGWALDGAPSVIAIGASTALFSGWDEMTIELWIRPDYPDGDITANESQFLGKGGPVDGGRLLTNGASSALVDAQIDFHFQGQSASCYARIGGLQRRKFNHVVWSFDAARGELARYLDGVPQMGPCTATDPLELGEDDVWLGGYGLGLVGVVDEVRLGRRGHSPAWHAVQYLSMSGQLLTIGDEQAAP
jgi:hypothetical protein